jgi:putative DNA primase/helicase
MTVNSDSDDGRGGDRPATVVPFPVSESVSDEERPRRLRVEVERQARLPAVERMMYLDGTAQKHGVDKAVLREMVAAVVRENEKKAREDRGELRRQEDRAERKQEREDQRVRRDRKEEAARSRKEIERERKEAERARKEAERIEREQEAKRVKREVAFAEIAELPKLTHEVRLKEAAKRLGEDFEFLVEEFEVFYAARTIPEDLEPWPESVDTAELLAAIEAKFRRYVVASDAVVTVSVLYAPFTYIIEIATHAPKLVYTFPEKDAGKSTALHVLRRMVQRPYAAIEATGAVLYRIIDRLRPTLLLDEADSLFKRRTVLAHVINESWSNSGTKIPRTGPCGEIVEFDPYSAQVIGMKGLNMADTTLSRSIICMMWPKLASEPVEEFTYQDDDEFKVIRRKLARWVVDNAVALRDARPDFPPGFNNRIRTNWKMLLAIAGLAGGAWPKRVRNAALELETDRDEPSENIRLFAALRDVWGKAEERTSRSLCAALAAHLSGEWADFRDKGSISQVQLAALLKPFGIRPIHNLHPTGRADKNLGGYRRAQFENAWARLLQKPPRDSLTRSSSRRRRRKR